MEKKNLVDDRKKKERKNLKMSDIRSILERNRKYRSNGTGNWSRNYSSRKSADVVPMETISPADLKDQGCLGTWMPCNGS